MRHRLPDLAPSGNYPRLRQRCARLAAWALPFIAVSLLAKAEVTLPLLKTKTAAYTNATVASRSDSDLYVLHAAGVANVKIRDLDPESCEALGLPDPNADTKASAEGEAPALAEANRMLGSLALRELPPELDAAFRAAPMNLRVDPTVILTVLAVCFAAYLFFCYCAMLICKKTGHQPGILVWLPVLQLFPLLRAAGMSGWWFLAFFVPLLNIVAQVLWCVNIIKARGKSLWLIVLFLLPFTNLIAFLYLAFSGTGRSSVDRRFAEAPPPLPA